uniref:Uncharacterized protein n=1 Tax=Panagrolaimus sp. JU765 TaxID=591449 RepID=A0AC34R5E9_9BILA
MRSVLVGVLFFCYLMPVVAGDGPENYGTTPMNAEKFYMNRFGKLIGEKSERFKKSFETANETTPNVSESEMVSFVDNSTHFGTNGTKNINELEHVADGTLNATMENVQRIKMDDLEENSTQIASFVDDSTQIGRNGNESTNLINLKHDGDELVKNAMENVTETEVNNSEEDLMQIAPSFLAQNEKSSEKYVKVENKVMEFLNDATVNVTVENNQLTLFVKDDNIRSGEQKLYFCFKSTIRSYVASTCPSGFCEVRIDFLTKDQRHTTYIDFDGHDQTFGGNFITAVISENSMKVTGVPNAPSPITTCNPDFEPGYLPVKVINKGDKTVRLSDVQLFKAKPEEAMATGTIIGIAVGGVAFVAVV